VKNGSISKTFPSNVIMKRQLTVLLVACNASLGAFAAEESKAPAPVLVDPMLLQLFTTPINPPPLISTNLTASTVTTLYLTKPAALKVVVPNSADDRMVHQPPSDKTFALKIIEPPLELEPAK
jgi:hypothetical protein